MPRGYPPGTAVVEYSEHAHRGSGGWFLSKGGETLMSSRNKSDLESRARQWAKDDPSQVELVIERKDGSIQDSVTYDGEPMPVPDELSEYGL